MWLHARPINQHHASHQALVCKPTLHDSVSYTFSPCSMFPAFLLALHLAVQYNGCLSSFKVQACSYPFSVDRLGFWLVHIVIDHSFCLLVSPATGGDCVASAGRGLPPGRKIYFLTLSFMVGLTRQIRTNHALLYRLQHGGCTVLSTPHTQSSRMP